LAVKLNPRLTLPAPIVYSSPAILRFDTDPQATTSGSNRSSR
jgi:hypothetical protein